MSCGLNASLVQRLSRTATRSAVSSSLGGNPSARANVATCAHVVTNAGKVVVVVVVVGITAGATTGAGAGACAVFGENAKETPKSSVIRPVAILWVTKAIIVSAFPFGTGYPKYLAPGF